VNIACTHTESIQDLVPPGDGCEICLAKGGTWMHLRQCLTCRVTLCCDSSPSQHMSRHWEATGHPIMRSAEPDEDWVWCQVDEANIRETDGQWTTYDPFVESGRWFVGRHLDAGGDLDVHPEATSPEGFPLRTWIDHVREQYHAGALDPADIDAIEALAGWTW
jgi:hypothetical protein